MYIINLLRGACMALADSVPGVSGGTIAFILGFYDDFINSLNTLVSKNSKDEKKKAIKFLINLGIGWVIAFLLAVLFISSLFESHIYEISSLFIGFIIFAIPLIVKEDKDVIKGNYKNAIFTLIGIAIVSLITYFNPSSSGSGMDVSVSNLSIGFCIYVFIAGMIAISAMVLPGISGSTLLLIFGLYAPIINAIKEVLSINLSYLPVLIIFGLGVITGILGTIKGIKYCLQNHRSKTIYLIIGLMIGSIYAVIMGPTTLKVPEDPMTLSTFKIIFFVIGGLLILGLDRIKTKMK
ncbi:DUF368 domain-containing protein [uncultured Clostridium sp.]|uniref:DUF368 domain-containing protein n=1 Tax=uncultured Clostridium sp. TaxID=59620 RepID=UPI0025CC13C6|nr:DUF368 domain-containing protein [uncultured Clostridium sp.]